MPWTLVIPHVFQNCFGLCVPSQGFFLLRLYPETLKSQSVNVLLTGKRTSFTSGVFKEEIQAFIISKGGQSLWALYTKLFGENDHFDLFHTELISHSSTGYDQRYSIFNILLIRLLYLDLFVS